MSVRRFDGWEPATRTTVTRWDAEGRPAEWSTTREPEFNDDDRAWFLALRDYQADLHRCGRPLSESLKVEGQTGPKYVIGTQICRACLALDSHYVKQAKADERIRKDGFNPSAYRETTVYTEQEMADIVAAQQAEPHTHQ